MKDRFFTVIFGAPPAMGKKTAEGIEFNTYTYINGNDPIPCLSTGTVKRIGQQWLLAFLTLFRSETKSLYLAASLTGMFDNIHTKGYENDEADKPIGIIYHMTWELWKEDGKKDLKTTKKTDFDYVNTMLSHHFISMYGKQFLAYKNGVMKPKDFDKDATEAEIKNVPLNFTVFDENDLFYYENSFFYR